MNTKKQTSKEVCPPEIQELKDICEKAQSLLDEAHELAKQADSLESRLIQSTSSYSQIAHEVIPLNRVFKTLIGRDAISMSRIIKFRRWLQGKEQIV